MAIQLKIRKVTKRDLVSFTAGVLIMIIVFMPFVMQPTFTFVESEVLYSEDAIVYNQVYNEIFDSLGEAGENSFLVLKTFNITMGIGVSMELTYSDNINIERFVFYEIEEGVVFRKVTLDTVPNPYIRIASMDGDGVYGIALFCTRISSSESISITRYFPERVLLKFKSSNCPFSKALGVAPSSLYSLP